MDIHSANKIITLLKQGDVTAAKTELNHELIDGYAVSDYHAEFEAVCRLPRDKSKEAGEFVEVLMNANGLVDDDIFGNMSIIIPIIQNDHDEIASAVGLNIFGKIQTLWADLCIQHKSWRLIAFMIKTDVIHVGFRSNAFMCAAVEEKNLDAIIMLLNAGAQWRLTGLDNLFMDGVLLHNNREKMKLVSKLMIENDRVEDDDLTKPVSELTAWELCYIIRREINSELRARRVMVGIETNLSSIFTELMSEKEKDKETEKEKNKKE